MKTLTNISQSVSSGVSIFPVQKLYELHKNGKFFYDRERLQRLLNEWIDLKKASYLSFLMNGGSCKDLFQIAEIAPIVEYLNSKANVLNTNYKFIQENQEYFSKLVNEGYEYIVLDGQHRIDTIARYFEDRFNFKPTNGSIILKNEEESGSIEVTGFFSKLPEEAKEYVRTIPVVVTTYSTGDLRELANIFITSNDMEPMTNHERRILNYNPINRWIISSVKNEMNLRRLFETISGMSGEYSLDHKGDTLLFAEMLRYITDNYYEGYKESDLNKMLGGDPENRIPVSDADRELTLKIFRIIADGTAKMDDKKLKYFTRSSIYNLFYTISFLLQKGNKFSKPKNIDGKFSIEKPYEFVKHFFDCEYKRMNVKGTWDYFESDSSNKQKKSVNDWSYRKHNGDQKHASKQSQKGVGGSEYDFDDWARVRILLADLEKDLTTLTNRNIISAVGSRSGGLSRAEALTAAGVPLSEAHKYHVNEIIPVSRGGFRVDGNIEVIPVSENLAQSDRPNYKEYENVDA